MTNKKKTLVVLLVLMTVFSTVANAGVYKTETATISEEIIITVNGEKVPFKAAIIEGKSYLPVRVIGYALNADVEWIEEGRKIELDFKEEKLPLKTFEDLISAGGKKKALFVDNMHLYLNSKYYDALSKEIVIIEERSYLPLRSISESIGIRTTWIEESKTIEIINPRTQNISEEDKDLYIKDLPTIETSEDYIVGNWVGNNSSNLDGVAYNKDSKLFISKQENGKYRVHRKDVFNDKDNPEYNGLRTETLYEDVTIDEDGIMLLGPHNGKIIFNNTPYELTPARKPYHLDGERLFGDFTDIGHLKSEYKRF